MYILGLSFGYHDSAAALIKDGEVIYASQEERFSRKKHDNSFPSKAITNCLNFHNLSISEIDKIVYYENASKKFTRISLSILKLVKHKSILKVFKELIYTCCEWIIYNRFDPVIEISQKLKIDKKFITYIDHHQSHAASTFYSSNFTEATVITIDGVGEFETFTVSNGKNNKLRKIHSTNFPNSIGLFYSTITSFLGFEINEGEYKVMGLAAFGQPKYYDEVKKLITFKNGEIKLNAKYFNFDDINLNPYTNYFTQIFGQPIQADFNEDMLEENDEKKQIFKKYADIASSFQKVTEEIVLEIIEFYANKNQSKNICFSGGVALNAVINGKIKQLNKYSLFVYPASGDAGCSVGAALFYYYDIAKKKRQFFKPDIGLGNKYNDNQIQLAINKFNIKNFEKFNNKFSLCQKVATKLSENKVVAWFQGRSEWGPRALGNRSIIANPSSLKMKSIINSKIKFREPFRPFAPIILAEEAGDYFEDINKVDQFDPENFMLTVLRVKKDKLNKIISATNVDNTARLQIINEDTTKSIRLLLENFFKISKIPVLINTSFNRRGEPIVETPENALNTFLFSDLDILVIENYYLEK